MFHRVSGERNLRQGAQAPVRVVVVLVVSALALGCGTSGPKAPAVEAALLERPEALFQLRSGGCDDGACPVYSVYVFQNGDGVYVGGAHVAVVGQKTMRLPNERVASLINELEKIDFLDTPEHCCDCPNEPDNPHACQFLIDYRPGGVEKEILVDERCHGLPGAIPRLASQIDLLTGIGPWRAPPVDGHSPRRGAKLTASKASGQP